MGETRRTDIEDPREITNNDNNEQKEITFEIDPVKKKCLIEGLDDIGLTLNKSSSISDFENNDDKITPDNIENIKASI